MASSTRRGRSSPSLDAADRRPRAAPRPTRPAGSAPPSTTSRPARASPEAAVNASLGCGVPTAVADLHDGETVLDLGSGAGADVLISARRVAPTGRAIGLDMTDEMLDLARANAAEAGVDNVEFIKGYLEDMPLADASVDVVISNCVINLSADKPKTIAEAARVLRPGGRFAVSDVIADPDMDDATRADMEAWTGCVAGALTETEFRAALTAAGLEQIEIQEDPPRPRARRRSDHPRPQARLERRAAAIGDDPSRAAFLPASPPNRQIVHPSSIGLPCSRLDRGNRPI